MKKILLGAATAAGLLGSSSAFAQTTQPVKLDVTLLVQTGCAINGGAKGTISSLLNFGTVSNAAGTTVNVDGSTEVSSGGTPFTIQCNNGLGQVTATIDGGANAQGGVRNLAGQTNPTSRVAFRLYSDANRTSEYLIGQPLVIFGSGTVPLTTVNVYGRILPAAIQAALPDTYTESLTMNISF